MSKKTREIFKLFDEASNHLSTLGGKIDTGIVNQLLSNLYSPGPSFQYIFDYSIREFIHISSGVKDVLGKVSHRFTANDFMEHMHPDDIKYFLHCEEIAKYFLFSFIAKEELPHYKVSYQFRLKNASGHYKLFLHQAIASSWEDDYKMSSSLANHSDISHITTINNKKMSFINIAGGQSYYGIRKIEDLHNVNLNKKVVSGRELEVLSLIAEGFVSQEIAEYLNIAVDTVATHRKNILKKTGFKTFSQATAHFIREGLI
ncbi:helix-turn-helix transcriptional regulator [Tamlana sp. 2201CG12-4]|uniref:response regulator transcription factor n=1 Tax=Tamlana sp. 2201CG12-4 TaxID=3112582 RepID=UPI002DB84D9D|nr:helix-turn-helix transcriptional regulator [Tamlana sp. 2201CG12-4]MEC3908128.1 helix-turn-helix transcriptional regulator [Tamlana sp. 2201CG12-4]